MNILITGKPAHYEKDSHTAIAFYRFVYPIKELTRTHKEIRVTESTTAYMPELGGVDLVLIHTPTSQHAIQAIAQAYEAGKKIWLDFDDLVFADDIPSANVAKAFFSNPENQKALAAAMMHADVITVSTNMIKDRIVELYKYPEDRVHVIHNALPDEVWEKRVKFEPFTKPSQKDAARIYWRGSFTHLGDLLLFRNAFKSMGNVAYTFHGHIPFMLETKYGGYLDRYNWRDWDKGVFQYISAIKQMRPHYVVVPLENCSFNHAKSNIAWLEGTLAGATCIGMSTMPEFDRIPCVKFDTPNSLERVFRAISKGDDLRTENYMHSRALIESQYLLSHTNRLRMDIINSL